MKLGFIKIYRNDAAFAKLHWLLFKLFGIKRTIPCGRRKDEHYLCCELWPVNENNSYLIHDEYGFEVRCKCCDTLKISGNRHPKTLQKAIDFNWEDEDEYNMRDDLYGEEDDSIEL